MRAPFGIERLNILLATAHPYLPQLRGGAQVNMHETALALLARGHRVAVAAGLTTAGTTGLTSRAKLKLRAAPVARDRRPGYPVYRSWFAWEGAAHITRAFLPDVVVAHSGFPARIGFAYRAAGVPVVGYFHNVEHEDLAGIDSFTADAWLANSRFTADIVRDRYGAEAEVIAPVFRPERYRVPATGDAVTFINPHPLKGLDTAIAIARACPELRFLFVKAWPLARNDARRLAALMADLPNVTVTGPVADMRSVYARTRLLLVPSQWQEAWGRVATEAHYSGIPVIGSRRGGIAEAIGPGGLLIDAQAPIEEWAAAVRMLMTDADAYRVVSEAALTYSRRPEIDLKTQIDAFEAACVRATREPRGSLKEPGA